MAKRARKGDTDGVTIWGDSGEWLGGCMSVGEVVRRFAV